MAGMIDQLSIKSANKCLMFNEIIIPLLTLWGITSVILIIVTKAR